MSDHERALALQHIEDVLFDLNDRLSTTTSWLEKDVLVEHLLGHELEWKALAA